MISLLLALQAATPAAPPESPEEDIVVMARKLRGWRGTISTNPFGTKCVTQVSTGDREIDRVGCVAMERCWPETRGRIAAAKSKKTPEADRPRLEAAARQDFITCLNPIRRELIEQLSSKRRVARDRTGA